MGRVKDWLIEEERHKFELAEAAYLALPKAQAEALEGIQGLLNSHGSIIEQNIELRSQLNALQNEFRLQTSAAAKWKERGFGFVLGCAASIVASIVWWRITKQWAVFG